MARVGSLFQLDQIPAATHCVGEWHPAARFCQALVRDWRTYLVLQGGCGDTVVASTRRTFVLKIGSIVDVHYIIEDAVHVVCCSVTPGRNLVGDPWDRVVLARPARFHAWASILGILCGSDVVTD